MALAGLDRRWAMHINLGADKLLRIIVLNAFSYNLEKRKIRGLWTLGVEPNKLRCRACKDQGTCDARGCQGLGCSGGDQVQKGRRCLSVLYCKTSHDGKFRKTRNENLMDLSYPLCLWKSVLQPSKCLSKPLTSSLGGLVRRFRPINDTRVGSRQPLGNSHGIFLF
jgi:hypothetical protein